MIPVIGPLLAFGDPGLQGTDRNAVASPRSRKGTSPPPSARDAHTYDGYTTRGGNHLSSHEQTPAKSLQLRLNRSRDPTSCDQADTNCTASLHYLSIDENIHAFLVSTGMLIVFFKNPGRTYTGSFGPSGPRRSDDPTEPLVKADKSAPT